MKNKSIMQLLTVVSLSILLSSQAFSQVKFLNKLKTYSDRLPNEFDKIPSDRQETLRQIGDYIVTTRQAHRRAVLLYICTHNSRRSQMGQVWGMTAAEYYGIDSTIFFSGGMEVTAFHPNAVEALKRAGFSIFKSGGTSANPNYFANNKKNDDAAWIMFSKKYNNRQNPQKDFAAIMVCSDADKSCPLVEGASARFSLPFDDPRYYDNTPSVKLKYDETCRQIAGEMFYLFDYVKKQSIINVESRK